MIKKFFLLSFIFVFSYFFSQKNKKTNTSEKIINKKNNNYPTLDSKLETYKLLSLDSLKKLNLKSKKQNYALGQIFYSYLIGIKHRGDLNYNLSIKYFKKALHLANKTNNYSLKIMLYNAIGLTYKIKNDLSKAIIYFNNAINEGLDNSQQTVAKIKNISIAEHSLGDIYFLLNHYNLALQYYNKALKNKNKIDNVSDTNITYHKIGYIYEINGDFKKALKNYELSLYLCKKNNYKIASIISKNSISSILIKSQEYEKALKILNENYKIIKKINDKNCYSQTINKLGLAHLKLGNFELSKKFLFESFSFSKKHNFFQHHFDALLHLSELHNKEENYEKALFYYKQAISVDKKKLDKKNYFYSNNLRDIHHYQKKLYKLRKVENQFKLVKSKLIKNRNLLILILILFVLSSTILYLFYRQFIIKKEKQVIKLKQQILQNQMKPHFIFNALNSIKLYVIKNDQKKAVYYLNKFSKLIRKILDVSKIKEISLKDELETVDLYIGIENIRFDNEINYFKKIKNTLNLDIIKVPPLVLQPFFENAIWHGLSSKKGKKNIVLSILNESDNFIKINILDNGIGREAAMNIKKSKNLSLNQKSIGVELTIERLKNFTKNFKNDASVKFYDLKDVNNNPIGTRVVIIIPLS